MIITILVLVYLVSCWIMYRWFQVAYSNGGIWEKYYTDGSDLIITFCPILNTLSGIILWIINYPKKKKVINIEKFFNIKR